MFLSDSPLLLPLQGTLRESVCVRGIGVHTGREVTVAVHPDSVGCGLTFVRMDQGNAEIPGTWDHVVDTQFSTTIGTPDGVTVSTVEHFLAALWALGIDNARIEVNGPEMPILDGSAAPWVQLLEPVAKRQNALAPVIQVLKTLRVQENNSWIEIQPSSTFSLHVTAPLGNGNQQNFTYALGDFFTTQVASARTFSLLKHVEKMRNMGLIQGGSLDNAVVIDDQGHPLNSEGFRFENECARHKALDLIGDWFLGGRLILADVRAYAPGHALNHKMLRYLLEDRDAWKPFSHVALGKRPTDSLGFAQARPIS